MNGLETRYISEKVDSTLCKEKLINQAIFQIIRNNDELLSSKKNLSNLNEKKGFHPRGFSTSLEFKVQPNGAFYWFHPLYIIWNNVHIPSNGGYINNAYFQEVMKKVKNTYPTLSIPKKNNLKHIKTESVDSIDINKIRCKGHKRGKSLDPKYLNMNKTSSQLRSKINRENEKQFLAKNKNVGNVENEKSFEYHNKINLEDEQPSQIQNNVNIKNEQHSQNPNKINLENEKSHQGRNKISIEDIIPTQSHSKVNMDKEKLSQNPNQVNVDDEKSSQNRSKINAEEKTTKKYSKIHENVEVENQNLKKLRSTEEIDQFKENLKNFDNKENDKLVLDDIVKTPLEDLKDNQKIKKPIYEKQVKRHNLEKFMEKEEEGEELNPEIKTDHWLHNNETDLVDYKNTKEFKNAAKESKQNMKTNNVDLEKNMVIQKLTNKNITNTSEEISNFIKSTETEEGFTSTILSNISSLDTTDKKRRFEMNPLFISNTSEKHFNTESSLHYFERDSTIFPNDTLEDNLRDFNEPSINPEVLLVDYKDSDDSDKRPEKRNEPWNLIKSDGSGQDIDDLVSYNPLSNESKISEIHFKNFEEQIFESNDFYQTENNIKESEITNIFSNKDDRLIEEIEQEYTDANKFIKDDKHFEGFEYERRDSKGFDNNNYTRSEDFSNYNLTKPTNQNCGSKMDKVTIFISDYSDENVSNDTLTYKMRS